MSEQYLIPLSEWGARRFSIELSNPCLVNYGRLGYIQPPPEKIAGKWLIDASAKYVGKGSVSMQPMIHEDDDDALKGILNHVTEATKK